MAPQPPTQSEGPYGRSAVLAAVTFAAFVDIVVYSIAVPVLPDFGRQLGASPTTIGLLFASFGLTLLTVSIPTGALSDRIGRRGPLVAASLAVAAATVLFAFSRSLPWLFAARLVQGAADALTWVVGSALLAEIYPAHERGRAMGTLLGGTAFGVMIGPSIGGWLYEIGGIELPFLVVSGFTVVSGLALWWVVPPSGPPAARPERLGLLLRVPAIGACVIAVVCVSATLSMFEPVLPLLYESKHGLGPAQVGWFFGASAVLSSLLHPFYGRLADKVGGGRLMLSGLVAGGLLLPLVGASWSPLSALLILLGATAGMNLIVAPSLAFIAETASANGVRSFGVVYGLYNMSWAVGLMAGPAIGGFVYERAGVGRLTLGWSVALLLLTAALARTILRAGAARSREITGSEAQR